MRMGKGLLLFFFILALQSPLFAKQNGFEENKLFEHANLLFLQNRCQSANLIYQRFINLFPNSQLRQLLQLQIAKCFFLNNNFEMSIRLLQPVFNQNKESSDADHHHYLLALSWFNFENYAPFSLRKPFIEQGIAQLQKVDHYRHKPIHEFLEELQLAPKPDYKSPIVAGSLSALIPGTGSFYADRYVEGSYSFFLTALFGLAASEALQQGTNTLGYLLGIVGLSFYSGSIYTAINSVHHYNDQLDQHRFDNIRGRFQIFYQNDF